MPEIRRSWKRSKAKELEAHIATKPAQVEQPNSLPPDQQQAVQAVADELVKERAALGQM